MNRTNGLRAIIETKKEWARHQGERFIDINAKWLHSIVGGYPYYNRMPMCCQAMWNLKTENDIVISTPPKGQGASLTIRYFI